MWPKKFDNEYDSSTMVVKINTEPENKQEFQSALSSPPRPDADSRALAEKKLAALLRERARRKRINEAFEEIAFLLNPKEAKILTRAQIVDMATDFIKDRKDPQRLENAHKALAAALGVSEVKSKLLVIEAATNYINRCERFFKNNQ